MASEDPTTTAAATEVETTTTRRSHRLSSEGWKERIAVPTLLAGAIGGGLGLVSRHRKTLGAGNAVASYAANLAIVAGCYCAAREVARDARASEPDDLINSTIDGFASGALLGRLQDETVFFMSEVFDYVNADVLVAGNLGRSNTQLPLRPQGQHLIVTLQLTPYLQTFKNTLSGVNSDKEGQKSSWWTLPEWSPIQVLDEEALEAKRAREKQLYSQSPFTELNKKES